jgi:ribA/ribD-fused uncharacterized protein
VTEGEIRFNSFIAEWAWLSNWWPAPVRLPMQGVVYRFPSTEAAYQCARQPDRSEEFVRPYLTATPRQAKFYSHQRPTRDDWNDVKLDAMRAITRAKFRQHPDLAAKLIATGRRRLVHLAAWRKPDRFWGVDADGRGENWQGRIIEEIRAELIAAQAAGDAA